MTLIVYVGNKKQTSSTEINNHINEWRGKLCCDWCKLYYSFIDICENYETIQPKIWTHTNNNKCLKLFYYFDEWQRKRFTAAQDQKNFACDLEINFTFKMNVGNKFEFSPWDANFNVYQFNKKATKTVLQKNWLIFEWTALDILYTNPNGRWICDFFHGIYGSIFEIKRLTVTIHSIFDDLTILQLFNILWAQKNLEKQRNEAIKRRQCIDSILGCKQLQNVQPDTVLHTLKMPFWFGISTIETIYSNCWTYY